jgi:23S rRNA (guanosine2251-2'-O)-methyltransferase
VAAWAPPLALVELEALLSERALIVALDGITDPQNLGAIIRCAVALGASGVLWGEHHSAPLGPATFRASAGAIEHARLCRVRSLRRAIEELGARKVRSVSLELGADLYLDAIDLTAPTLLVIGSEDRGVRPGVRQLCHAHARLRMESTIASLNASVAAALALYEAQRQRRS